MFGTTAQSRAFHKNPKMFVSVIPHSSFVSPPAAAATARWKK